MFNALRKRRARTLIQEVKENWFICIQCLSPETIRYYRRNINAFFNGLSYKYLYQIKTADIQNFITKSLWHKKKSSVNTSIAALKSFFGWVSDTYDIPNITISVKRFKAEMPHQPFISKEQYEKILQSATPRESDIIKMLANTGMRCSELAGLKLENISPNLSSLRICGRP